MKNLGKVKILVISFLLLFASAVTFAQIKPIGIVIISSGEFYAINIKKVKRTLIRRSPIFLGDTLYTGDDGRGQIRFIDESVISLRPNTEFILQEYNFDINKPEKNKSISELVKGGLRNVSGLIAKQNPKEVKVKTDLAVIAIRGTDYTAVISGEQLYTYVKEGEISLTNSAGTLNIGPNQPYRYAIVPSSNQIPVGLSKPPRDIFPCP